MSGRSTLLHGIYVPPPRSCQQQRMSRRARALVILLCFAAIATTALLARDLRDVAASLALGLLLALVVHTVRAAAP